MSEEWRQRFSLFPDLGKTLNEIERGTALLAQLNAKLDVLDSKLDRMWLNIDFVRTRLSAYLGHGTALTYLADETPIFVNTDDSGCPVNFLNGGRYEEDNLDTLLSFVTDTTVFLDIGANLGFFAVTVGQRVARGGRVHAFEPHPLVFELMTRTIFLNGLRDVVTCHNFGLSDHTGPVEFQFPVGHIGGGALHQSGATGEFTRLRSEVKELDRYFDPGFTCDLVKIDVEGHELHVLRGMTQIISRSPRIKILFEKLGTQVGSEAGLKKFFDEKGMKLFGTSEGARLVALDSLSEFQRWDGYVLAVRPEEIENTLNRARFTISPRQLNIVTGSMKTLPVDGIITLEGNQGEVLFHGPYWFLKRGVWRLMIRGTITGRISLTIAERFGYKVLELSFDESCTQQDFICARDLVNFECVARSAADPTSLSFSRLEFERLG